MTLFAILCLYGGSDICAIRFSFIHILVWASNLNIRILCFTCCYSCNILDAWLLQEHRSESAQSSPARREASLSMSTLCMHAACVFLRTWLLVLSRMRYRPANRLLNIWRPLRFRHRACMHVSFVTQTICHGAGCHAACDVSGGPALERGGPLPCAALELRLPLLHQRAGSRSDRGVSILVETATQDASESRLKLMKLGWCAVCVVRARTNSILCWLAN